MKHARKGCFTLLEVIAAMAMTAIIVVSLFSAFHIGFRAQGRAEQRIAPIRRLTGALEKLRQDLESAMPPTGILAGPFILQPAGTEAGLLNAGERSIVEFYTVNQDIFGGAHGLRRIEYVLLDQARPDDPVLLRRVTDNLLALVVAEPIEEVVCRRVASFEVTCFDGLEWRESWDSTTLSHTLPVAVKLDLAIWLDQSVADSETVYRLSRKFTMPAGRLQE